MLGITSIVLSRIMFALFDDTEGPNLLIVMVMAAIVYALSSLAAHVFIPSITGKKKILSIICIQVVIVTVAYFLLS